MGNASPFDATAAGYDAEFTHGRIGTLARERFWRRLTPCFAEGAALLELGGGTGEDACYFASQGARVTLTDASGAMVAAAREKVSARGLDSRVQCLQLDMTQLHLPEYRRAVLGDCVFEGAYSNFGAVNCVPDLAGLATGLASVLKAGAPLFLTVMGPLVPWEWGWYLARGKPSTAFRRLRRGGTVWRGLRIVYPSPRDLERAFAPRFALAQCSVVNAFVPPSYCEAAFAGRPGLLSWLDRMDERCVGSRVGVRLADHYLAHFVCK